MPAQRMETTGGNHDRHHGIYLMAQEPRARLFGRPTAGGFGNVSVHEDPHGAYALVVNWTRQTDDQGQPLQGRSVAPDVELRLELTDLVAGTDTIFAAALAWIQEQ